MAWTLLIEAGASVEPGKGRNMGKWVELGRRADGGTVRRESAHRWTALHRAAIGPHGAQRTHAALCHDGRAWADVAMALLAAGADPLRADAHGVRRILPSPPNSSSELTRGVSLQYNAEELARLYGQEGAATLMREYPALSACAARPAPAGDTIGSALIASVATRPTQDRQRSVSAPRDQQRVARPFSR